MIATMKSMSRNVTGELPRRNATVMLTRSSPYEIRAAGRIYKVSSSARRRSDAPTRLGRTPYRNEKSRAALHKNCLGGPIFWGSTS